MGQFGGNEGVKIRDGGSNPDRLATVTANNALLVEPFSGSTWTIGLPSVTLSTDGVVSVSNAETTILAANSNRKDAFIENLDASVLQLHFTTGQAFGSGPVQLRQYESFNAAQTNGAYRGVIYGIRAAATGSAGVVEEV